MCQIDSLPSISTIIPVYNGERFLTEAITSVLQQNYPASEIIVVDDGSTDDTAQVVAGFGQQVRYCYQPNQGAAAARNHGIAEAKGEWLAFLDSDDWWAAGRLCRQVALLQARPTAKVIWGMLQVVRQCAPPVECSAPQFQPVGKPLLQTQFGSALIHHTLFAATQVGRIDAALWTNDDADWFFRLFEKNVEIVIQQEVVAFYRWHQSNLVANQRMGQATSNTRTTYGLLHALSLSIRRRRAGGGDHLPNKMNASIHWVGTGAPKPMEAGQWPK